MKRMAFVYPMQGRGLRVPGCALGLAMIAALVGGCAETVEETGASKVTTTVRFALEATDATEACPVSLRYPQVKSIRLRLYEGTPTSPDGQAPFFDTSDPSIAPDGCLSFVQCTSPSVRIDAPGSSLDARVQECKAAGGATVEALEINVTDVAPSSNVSAYLEAFSDESCGQRVFVGVRGGIDIESGDSQRGYFIQPLCVGHFTELPNPADEDTDFVRAVAAADCAADCDCIDAFSATIKMQCSAEQKSRSTVPGAPLQCQQGRCSTGHAFEDLITLACNDDEACQAVYPQSACGANGFCRITSYYPLNMRLPRAFHTATPLPDGRIVLLGGLSAREIDDAGRRTFLAADGPAEVYDPMTGTFDVLEVRPAEADSLPGTETRRAFHTATLLRNGQFLAVGGGIQEIQLEVSGEGNGRKLQISTPAVTTAENETNMLSSLLVVDTESLLGRVKALGVDSGGTRAPQPFALHTASTVLSHGTEELFMVGGIAPEDTPITTCDGKDTAPYADVATNCQVGDPAEASCKVNTCVLHAPRAGATSVCFSSDDAGVCTAYATVGGGATPKSPLGELFATPDPNGSGSFEALGGEGADELRQAKFAAAVSNPDTGKAWWFGGASANGFDSAPNVGTWQLELSADAKPTLVAKAAETAALGDATLALRSHHQATELDGGLVLVSGGLDPVSDPRASALLFDPDANAYLERKLTMVRKRFGHQATRISSGLLSGAVLVTGGLTIPTGSKAPELVPTAEIFIPE